MNKGFWTNFFSIDKIFVTILGSLGLSIFCFSILLSIKGIPLESIKNFSTLVMFVSFVVIRAIQSNKK